MIEYDFLSRNVKDRDSYRKMRDDRLVLKKAKDPRQEAYKIVLNSTYGASNDKYNNLFDPRQAHNVCVHGQLLLLDLIEHLEPHWKLIQSNTDGVIGLVEKPDDIEVIKKVAAEWEKRTRLDLEWDEAVKIYQKDVNNYVLIHADGSYKSKGAYVKKLDKLDYDLPIVNKAVINYFINGDAVEKTILNCHDLIEFQKIVKFSSKYDGGVHGNRRLMERCIRIFASKNAQDGGIFKINKKTGTHEKVANTPENAFINNGDINGVKVPNNLDKDWYIKVAKNRVIDFIGGRLE